MTAQYPVSNWLKEAQSFPLIVNASLSCMQNVGYTPGKSPSIIVFPCLPACLGPRARSSREFRKRGAEDTVWTLVEDLEEGT